MESITQFVEGRLKLKVNVEKSAVDRHWKRKFLGFSFTAEKQSRIRLASKTTKRFKDKIRQITSRRWAISMEDRIWRLNQYLRGWIGYFQLVETPSVLQSLDKWIRRRLRMCRLKECKKPKTKRRKLAGLGIPEEWARLISGSRKAYWRDRGLFSLGDTYRRLRGVS